MTLRALGIITGCVLVSFGVGWYTGSSNRATLSAHLVDTAIRWELAEIRGALLEAQISLAATNFGDARQAMQRAASTTASLQERMRADGQVGRATTLEPVLAQLQDADRFSAALDPTASAAVAAALRALDVPMPTRPSPVAVR